MKTLILTSSGLKIPSVREAVVRILPKPLTALKMAYISTAYKVEERTVFADLDIKALTEMGFQIEEIDITGKDYTQLHKMLRDKDVIYVQGGNTFYLLKEVKASGFDKLIKELLERGVIYIGVSAGSYIACPTIEMATWPKKEKEQFGLTDLTALSLVPFLLSVHYNREKYREGLSEGITKTKYPVRILTDDQAFLIQDDVVTLIGSGEEIRL